MNLHFNVSYISNRFEPKTKLINIEKWLEAIGSGVWREAVEKYRNTLNHSIKLELGGLSLSEFENNYAHRNNLKKTSLIAFDIDNLNDKEMEEVQEKLQKHRYVFAMFKSIGGKGLWFICKLPEIVTCPNAFRIMHNRYRYYWENFLGVKIDKQSSDCRRIITNTYDKDIYYNSYSYTLFHVNVDEELETKKTEVEPDIDINLFESLFTKSGGVDSYDDWFLLALGLTGQENGEDIFVNISLANIAYKDSEWSIRRKFRNIKEGTEAGSNNHLFLLLKRYDLLEKYEKEKEKCIYLKN